MSATEVLSALDRIHGTVSVIGSMNADYTVTAQRLPGPGETITGGPLQLLPGGKSGNQAAAAARIGATVQMFGAVGSDSNADFLLGALGEAGVNTTHVRRVLGASGTTVITVDAAGENTIVYSPGSNAQVTVDYVESVRDAFGEGFVLGGDGHRRRQAERQFLGEGGAGDDRQRVRITQRFAGNVLQQASGFGFQSFCRPDNARIRAHQRLNLTEHVAKYMARDHNQNVAAGRQRGRKIAFQVQGVRERNVREKRHVAAVVLQRRDMFRVVAPQDHVVTISCQRDGKSGAV